MAAKRPQTRSLPPRPPAGLRPLWLVPLLCLALLTACDDMTDDARLRPFEPNPFFKDGQSARPIVDGTVPRQATDSGLAVTVPLHDEQPVPRTITRQFLERGRERYGIYCALCHGDTGHGDGMIVQRGFTPPPSFHIDRLREAPDAHFIDVISNGFGAMYSYNDRVPPRDRAAITAYIRALQLSQHADVSQLPPEDARETQQATELIP